MVNTFVVILLIFLVICAIATCFCKNILTSVVIFMTYSVVMSIIWMIIESPDLAITEAAVGAGVTSVLFFVTLKKIRLMFSNENDNSQTGSEENEDVHHE